MFSKTNQPKHNLAKTQLSIIQIAKIKKCISLSCGYRTISAISGISVYSIKKAGFKTSNKPSKLLRAKKCSLVNPSVNNIDGYVDLSDITTMSLRVANKRPRILKWNNQSIKMSILALRSETIVQLTKVNTRGETKALWSNIMLEAIGRNAKLLAIDTNCKFKDSPITLVHLVKDPKHPYNQVVEAKIGNIKTRIYNNIQTIKQLDIDSAIAYIKELIEVQLNKTVKIEIKLASICEAKSSLIYS